MKNLFALARGARELGHENGTAERARSRSTRITTLRPITLNPFPTGSKAPQFADDRVVRVSHVGAIRTMQVLSVAMLVTGCIGWQATRSTAASAPVYTLSNPSVNITPSPNILSGGYCTGAQGALTCTNPCVTTAGTWPTYDNDAGCTLYTLAAINNARSEIDEPALVLPSNWYTLTIAEQLFVMADMERVGDGYPAFLGINSSLTAEAQTAAAANRDPSVAPGFSQGDDAWGVPGDGGTWAEGTNVLFADYYWMYYDGWGGSSATSNIDCTSATAPGCWGHRDELLGADPGVNPGVGLDCTTCEVGTGYAVVDNKSSYVDLVELPAVAPPAMTFTWDSELAYFPGGLPYAASDSSVTTVIPMTMVDMTPPIPVLSTSPGAFTTGTLKVQWSTGTIPVAMTRIVISKGAGCSNQAADATTAVEGTTNGVASFTYKNYFSTTTTYSARLLVWGTSGTVYTGTCLAIGTALAVPVLSTSRGAFTTGTLNVQWSMGSTPVVKTTLTIYKGVACTTSVSSVAGAVKGVTHGVARFTRQKYFSTKVTYSARLLVWGTSGLRYTGACLRLPRA